MIIIKTLGSEQIYIDEKITLFSRRLKDPHPKYFNEVIGIKSCKLKVKMIIISRYRLQDRTYYLPLISFRHNKVI